MFPLKQPNTSLGFHPKVKTCSIMCAGQNIEVHRGLWQLDSAAKREHDLIVEKINAVAAMAPEDYVPSGRGEK